jgi:hypothetical protein
VFRFNRIGHSRVRRSRLWFRLWSGRNGATARGDCQGKCFAMRQWSSAAPENLLADGSVNLSIGKHPWRQDDIRAVVGFINDGVCDVRGLHGTCLGGKDGAHRLSTWAGHERGCSTRALSHLLSRHAERDELAGALGAAVPLGRG